MSGPPPPFGQPWFIDVGRNPNINHDPPPPPPAAPGADHFAFPIAVPVDGAASGAAVFGIVVNDPAPGAAPMQQQNFAAGIPMGPPPPYGAIPPPAMMGMPPFGMGMMPGANMAGGSSHLLPPPPNPGSGVSPVPWGGMGMGGMGMGGMGGMGMGMGMMNPGMMNPMGMGGMGMGMGMPPPFAPGGMPWAGSGGSMAFGPNGFYKPPPMWIESGGGVGPEAAAQEDPTTKPGGDLPGHTVVEAGQYTSIIRILTNCLPWETYMAPLRMEPMQFDSGWTLNRVIAQMRKPETDCQGWGVTNCIELGGGRWAKGMTYIHGSAQASEQTLGMIGWDSSRNRNGKSPLYVVCHRV
jgi:hypothetical protein